MSAKFNKLPLILFVISLMATTLIYGMLAEHLNLFPANTIKNLVQQSKAGAEKVAHVSGIRLPWYYKETRHTEKVVASHPEKMQPGLTLINGLGDHNTIFAKVLDPQGNVVQQWDIDWFKIWPDATHLNKNETPRSRPGTFIHGMNFQDNGDFIFNFEYLGMVSLDICGNIKWRLPYRTHHSLFQAEDGTLWVPGRIVHQDYSQRLASFPVPFDEDTLLNISPQGKILQEISTVDLLEKNNLRSLLHMTISAQQDRLHLNSISVFPSNLSKGIFQPGDIMLSFRNINTVLVFDPHTEIIKYVFTGPFLRQHDPHFIDGNTISLFENHYVDTKNEHYSRIMQISALTNKVTTQFKGSPEQPFFTRIMGKHQLLANHNILISEPLNGRTFEINDKGEILWEYFNIIRPGILGLLNEAKRLPPKYDKEFFKTRTANCHPIQETS